jgi:hypothetical protein
VLTPLPGTELWESTKSQITTTDYNLFDVMHLVLPSKLPPERFFQRLARLYCLMDETTQLSWAAIRKLTGLVLEGKGFAVRRVLSASREMRNAKAYLQYPGSTPKPEFVPPEHGLVSWIEQSRSHLAERLVKAS